MEIFILGTMLGFIIGTESKVRLGIIEWAVLEELIQFWEDNNGKQA